MQYLILKHEQARAYPVSVISQVRLQKLERHLNMKTERFNELKNTFKNHAELPVPESKKISAFADGFTAELDAIDRDHDMLDFQGLEDCLKELRDSQSSGLALFCGWPLELGFCCAWSVKVLRNHYYM